MPERRIIRGAAVLALDGRRSVRKNDILIEDGKIAATGGVSAEGLLTDVRGMVMPGLVQAHLQLTDSLLDSGFVASADPRILERIQLPAWRSRLGERAAQLCCAGGISRALAAGVTAFANASVIHRNASVETARAFGVRFIACVDAHRAGFENELEVLAQTVADDSIRPGIAVDASAASTRLLRRVAQASEETGAPILAGGGGLVGAKNAVRKLRRSGALGPRLLLHSARDLDLAAARAIGDARATVALSPGHDLLIGAPPPPMDALLEARVRVAIGSGGNASRLGFDPFAEARLLLRFLEGKIESPATYALDSISPNGAMGLGLPGGMIEAGKAADLVLLDIEHDPLETYEQTARRVLEQGGASAVRTVWIAGKVVATDGKPRLADPPPEADEEEMRAKLLPHVKQEEERRQVTRAIGTATRALWRARGWRI